MGFFRRAGANKPGVVAAQLANTQAGHDAARSRCEEDGLDRLSLAQSMYRTIKATPAGYSTRIGLYGEWGAGKTTVLNFLSDIAQSHDDVVVHVSAWRAVDADSFVASLSDAMRAKVKALNIAVPWYLKWKYWGAKTSSGVANLSQMTGQASGKIDNDMGTMVTMGAALTGSVASLVQQRLGLEVADLEQLRALLQAHQVIVFIDDLDRADPVILPKTLMALREYLDLPGFAFVLAFDKAIITRSLRAYSRAFSSSRQAFLDKIIDFEFELKALPRNLSSRFAAYTLAQYCDFIPPIHRDNAAEWFPDNPRLTRTIARELGSLKDVALRHGQDELKWEAIILQTLLRREAPECAAIVEEKLLGRGTPTLVLAFNQERKTEAMTLLVQALAASGFQPGSAAFNRYSRLVVRMQGLRALDTPERIRSEMLLSTREPCFSQHELLKLIERWDQTQNDRVLAEALQFAGKVACTNPLQVAVTLMNLTLDHYDLCIQRMSEQKVIAQRRLCLQEAEQTARFLWRLLQADETEDLYRATTQVSIGIRVLESFASYSRRDYPLDELWLRCIEGWMMPVLAARCQNQVALFYRCTEYEIKEQGPASMPPIVQKVHALTASAAVKDILGMFTAANAIHLCSLESVPSSRLELLRNEGSVLYSKPHKQTLLKLLEGGADREQQHVLAKNAMDYLSLQLDRNDDLQELFKAHPEVLSSCWRLVISEQWRQETNEMLHWMRGRLEQRGIDVAGLPDPCSAFG
ncbi:KAP family P-loop NTPase fold protein [Pseudomonas alkylphenolica]|uniref:KAP family P-loop NTPase fold protein n=1 Tax=Pseudomonas alkylphenolica TaxID=237609 RepID=UPI000FB47532